MKLSEALEEVNKKYIPGVVGFYSKFPKDPWMKAHDDLERAALSLDPKIVSISAQTFVLRCLKLIDQYREASGEEERAPSLADAFHMGDPARVEAAHSKARKICFFCSSEDDLKIETFGKDNLDTRLACPKCKDGGYLEQEMLGIDISGAKPKEQP